MLRDEELGIFTAKSALNCAILLGANTAILFICTSEPNFSKASNWDEYEFFLLINNEKGAVNIDNKSWCSSSTILTSISTPSSTIISAKFCLMKYTLPNENPYNFTMKILSIYRATVPSFIRIHKQLILVSGWISSHYFSNSNKNLPENALTRLRHCIIMSKVCLYCLTRLVIHVL